MKIFKTANEPKINSNIPRNDNVRKGIMVVDDSKFARNLLKDILKNEGYLIVGEAGDGLEAIEVAGRTRPECIFMDVEMPKLDGLGAIPKILEIDPNIQIIMCTAMGQKSIIVEAVKFGAKDYVLKPYKKENIISVLKENMEYKKKNRENDIYDVMKTQSSFDHETNRSNSRYPISNSSDRKETYRAREEETLGKLIKEDEKLKPLIPEEPVMEEMALEPLVQEETVAEEDKSETLILEETTTVQEKEKPESLIPEEIAVVKEQPVVQEQFITDEDIRAVFAEKEAAMAEEAAMKTLAEKQAAEEAALKALAEKQAAEEAAMKAFAEKQASAEEEAAMKALAEEEAALKEMLTAFNDKEGIEKTATSEPFVATPKPFVATPEPFVETKIETMGSFGFAAQANKEDAFTNVNFPEMSYGKPAVEETVIPFNKINSENVNRNFQVDSKDYTFLWKGRLSLLSKEESYRMPINKRLSFDYAIRLTNNGYNFTEQELINDDRLYNLVQSYITEDNRLQQDDSSLYLKDNAKKTTQEETRIFSNVILGDNNRKDITMLDVLNSSKRSKSSTVFNDDNTGLHNYFEQFVQEKSSRILN